MSTHWFSLVVRGLREKAYWITAASSAVSSKLDDVIEETVLPTIAAAVTAVNGGYVSVLSNQWRKVVKATDTSSAFITSTRIPRGILFQRQLCSTVIRRGNHEDSERICTRSRSVRERVNGARS